MRRITTADRRARLVARHHLGLPAAGVDAVAAGLVGFHSSDPVSVYLSAWARVDGFVAADLESALYERKSLVRMLGMRRTLFVVPTDLASIMDIACARQLASAERRRLVGMIEDQNVARDGNRWLSDVEGATMAALQELGEATATELTVLVPELGEKLMFGEGKSWGGPVGVSTRVLFMLATTGRILRGRPRGTWKSSQYRWAPTNGWLKGGLDEVEADWAETELLRRWLDSYGPGTMTDLRWWAGWTLAKTRRALARLDVEEVALDTGTGLVLADDLDPVDPPEPSIALLPGLDPSVMGWNEREWFLSGHQAQLFDTNGNAGPTVWVDGRVVGGWAQRADGEIAVKLLEDVGAEATGAVAMEAHRLTAWLGDLRIKPRFRVPLERKLSS
ncbi:MAG: winged helix DNA-binding domain-containing protein [Acidimicrobiia bacterium]|nr:winged helix DNA-binding domain-containing protein [Acidimicrobiia bacterium]